MKKRLPLFGVVAAVLGILAAILCVMPAYVIETTVISSTSSVSYSLFNLMFGCDVTVDNSGNPVASIGLIIGFILLILAIIAVLACAFLSAKKKNKKMNDVVTVLGFTAFAFFITAGILVFFALKMTGLSVGAVDFAIIKGKSSMGAGIYLVGIISILAGLISSLFAINKFIK